MSDRGLTAGKFFGVFFIVHLLLSAGYYFLAGRLDGASPGIGAGNVGLGMFGAMYLLFGSSGGRAGIEPTVLPLLFLVNSSLTAGVATGVFLVVRRLRAA